MTEDRQETTSQKPANKADRVLQKYDLVDLGDDLVQSWLGENGEQASTRELTDRFNRRVLEAAIEDSDAFTLSGDIEQVYETLVGNNEGDSTLVRSRLEQNGVDVDDVMDDFVSHQTIYRYLTEHRGVEQKKATEEERIENAVETIQRLRGRTTAVTERTVDNFRESDSISIGEFSVFNDIQVLCEDCGRSYDVADLLERGGCECESE